MNKMDSIDLTLQLNYPPWCLIPSEPDVFTDMIRRFGIKNVVAQDILDLDELPELSQITTYGITLAYRYREDPLPQNADEEDSDAENIIFSAQLILNSCATLSIVNIISNVDIDKGDLFQNFIEFTEGFDSINRGLALGNIQEIRDIHNSYKVIDEVDSQKDFKKGAKEAVGRKRRGGGRGSKENSQDSSDDDSQGSKQYESSDDYHFVGYIFKEGFIWELDGMKKHPVKLMSVEESENWLVHLKTILSDKIGQDNLDANVLALVKDPIAIKEENLARLYETTDDLTKEADKEWINPESSSSSKALKSPPLTPKGRTLLQKKREVEEEAKKLSEEIAYDKKELSQRMDRVVRTNSEFFPAISKMAYTAISEKIDLKKFQYPTSTPSTHVVKKHKLSTKKVTEIYTTKGKGKDKAEMTEISSATRTSPVIENPPTERVTRSLTRSREGALTSHSSRSATEEDSSSSSYIRTRKAPVKKQAVSKTDRPSQSRGRGARRGRGSSGERKERGTSSVRGKERVTSTEKTSELKRRSRRLATPEQETNSPSSSQKHQENPESSTKQKDSKKRKNPE